MAKLTAMGQQAGSVCAADRTYTLIGADGRSYQSRIPGTLGGHKRSKIYGRLDCPSALRHIANGGYVRHRVFFASDFRSQPDRPSFPGGDRAAGLMSKELEELLHLQLESTVTICWSRPRGRSRPLRTGTVVFRPSG